ncbi:unnamed protein product [Urochloa humidicola]
MIMSHLARQERPAAAVASTPAMIGLAGLGTASTAVTLAVSDPPPGLEGNAYYYLTLSGVFYAGVAELGAAVWCMSDPYSHRIAAGRKLLYASLVPLAAAGGLAVATLFWPGF